MANLLNTQENTNPEGFNPVADNRKIDAQSSAAAKIIWFLSFLLIIPLIFHIIISNRLNRNQIEINETASGIDVQLKKRRDTLVKLVDATSSFVKHEKSLFEGVTRLRNLNIDASNRVQVDSEMSSAFGRLLATAENYPDLKSNQLVQETMESARYIEQEIAAARRLYNSQVTTFNSQLVQWPSNIIAQIKRFSTFPLFVAAAVDRQDVSLSF